MKKETKRKIGPKHPLRPRLKGICGEPLNTITLDNEDLEEPTFRASIFEDCSAADRKAEFITFDRAIFRKVVWSGTRFRLLKLRDSSYAGCDLNNARWSSSFWHRVEVNSCRMTGLDATSSRVQNVFFKDCKLNYACFRFGAFKATRFEDCDLTEADFQGADLRGCVFKNCNLRNTQLSQTQLEGADLRDSKLEGIKVAPENLKNVTVDFFQASYLAGLMGLIIK